MSWTKVYQGSEPVRINKWLAQEGVCSRREADALLEKGLLVLNGVTVTVPGERIGPGQTLALKSEADAELGSQVSIILNKPVGFVSGTPEPGEVPAVRLLTRDRMAGTAGKVPARDASLAPLGRLDKDSHGLLILSEDGVLAKAVIGPASAMDKEYLVRVLGDVSADRIQRLRHGLELDGRQLKPAIVEEVGKGRLTFILTEGRNRQIRRMCQLVGLKVVDLERIRIGPLRLSGLDEGRWRYLTPSERQSLIEASAGTTQAKPERPPKPARKRGGKPPAKSSAKAPVKPAEAKSQSPSPLKGAKFKRTKLPPRPRKPIR